jgi:hypothetical protein
MPITIELRDEAGRIQRRVIPDLSEIDFLNTANSESFPMLRGIDRWDETWFNRKQIYYLIPELVALQQSTEDDAHRDMLSRTIELARRATTLRMVRGLCR